MGIKLTFKILIFALFLSIFVQGLSLHHMKKHLTKNSSSRSSKRDRSESESSKKGHGQPCEVEGCKKCISHSADTCKRCIDKKADLVLGKCVCPTDKPMNNDGKCQDCAASYCLACVTGN